MSGADNRFPPATRQRTGSETTERKVGALAAPAEAELGAGVAVDERERRGHVPDRAHPGGVHPDGPRRSLYLDLPSYCEAQDRRSTPYTPSVQVFYALREALAELEDEGGWQARNGRYRHLLGIARDGLHALGIEPLLLREDCSVVLNAFRLPYGIGYTELHDRLKDRGFIIYAGQGDLATTLFRVSAMGTIAVADMERFVGAVREAIAA